MLTLFSLKGLLTEFANFAGLFKYGSNNNSPDGWKCIVIRVDNEQRLESEKKNASEKFLLVKQKRCHNPNK